MSLKLWLNLKKLILAKKIPDLSPFSTAVAARPRIDKRAETLNHCFFILLEAIIVLNMPLCLKYVAK